MKGAPCVYAIIASDGSAYVGSTFREHRRRDEHERTLSRGAHHCLHLQYAWDKYGRDSFEFVVLEYIEDNDESVVLKREQAWIDRWPCLVFNTALVAGSPMRGRTHLETTRALLSAKGKGLKRSAETRAKMSKPKSAEHRSHMGLARIGVPLRQDTIDKMRAAQIGRPRGPMSESTKEKIRVAKTGKKRAPFSDEWKRRLADVWRGRKHTEATRQKMRLSQIEHRRQQKEG